MLVALTAHAHAPFATSTRLFVHDTTLELELTVGMEGGARFMQGFMPAMSRVVLQTETIAN